MSMVKTPSLKIIWKRGAPAAKYVRKAITLEYYVLDGFSDEKLAMFVASVVDGDGMVRYFKDNKNNNVYVYVDISACLNCPTLMC